MANAVSGRRINNADRELCKPCLVAGQRKGARNFCQHCACRICDACLGKHKTSADTIDHEVFIGIYRADMGEAAGRGNEPNGRDNESPGCNESDGMCPLHPDKKIEFYCRQHKRVFCYVCDTVSHRGGGGCRVDYIPDIADQELRRIDISARIRKLDTLLNNSLATQRQASNNFNSLQDALTEAMRQIETFRSEINRTLDNWESDLKETLNRKRQSSMTMSPSDLERFSDLKEQLEQLQTHILQQRKSQNIDRLFIKLIQADTLLEENEQQLARLNDPSVNVVMFKRNEKITAMLKTERCLGEIVSVSSSTRSVDSGAGSLSGSIGSQRAIATKEINVKTGYDRQTCWITSMIVLAGERIVVADHNNSSVKLVDIVTSKVISWAQLTSGPWEMTQMPNNHFVVTLFNEEALEFMCISENKVRSLKKVTTYGRCQGVAYSQIGLLVTFISPPRFEIYSIEGIVISRSPEMPRLQSMFHITITRDSRFVIVGNDKPNSLVKMDFNGNIIKEYRNVNINVPRGLVCHEDGSIFVCSKKDHSVLRVSADMTQCVVVMKRAPDFSSIKNPYAVAYDSQSALLFISCSSGKSKYDNIVKIFQMDDILSSSFSTSF